MPVDWRPDAGPDWPSSAGDFLAECVRPALAARCVAVLAPDELRLRGACERQEWVVGCDVAEPAPDRAVEVEPVVPAPPVAAARKEHPARGAVAAASAQARDRPGDGVATDEGRQIALLLSQRPSVWGRWLVMDGRPGR